MLSSHHVVHKGGMFGKLIGNQLQAYQWCIMLHMPCPTVPSCQFDGAFDCRGSVKVEVCMRGDTAQASGPDGLLELWTYEGTHDAPSTSPTSSTTDDDDDFRPGSQLLVHKAFSPIKNGVDKYSNDMIIGKPGMRKLKLGISAYTSMICTR